MFDSLSDRLRTTLAVSAIALATAPALASAATPLPPQAPPGGGEKPVFCYYAGQKYSEGSSIRMADGFLHTCRSGAWN